MIKNHWHRTEGRCRHCRMTTAASAPAQTLGLKVSTSTIHGQDLVHKAGQRHLGAAFGSTEFSALKMGRIWCTGQDLVHKAGQRHLGAAVGSTEFRGLPKWESCLLGSTGGPPGCDCCYSTPCSLCHLYIWATTSLDLLTAHYAYSW